jgi:OFA family oxalate/formate antiporter-like MFS transporter
MALIANLQYGWTLFVNPIHVARGWSQAKIQWAFSIFIATETWLTPPAGAIVDRLRPRLGPSDDRSRRRPGRPRLGGERRR